MLHDFYGPLHILVTLSWAAAFLTTIDVRRELQSDAYLHTEKLPFIVAEYKFK